MIEFCSNIQLASSPCALSDEFSHLNVFSGPKWKASVDEPGSQTVKLLMKIFYPTTSVDMMRLLTRMINS